MRSRPGISVYLDAGNPNWILESDMAPLLNQAGIGAANGFALNVSNFVSTRDCMSYGARLSALVGGKGFIIDTSRNGQPAPLGWCNPPGCGLGPAPTSQTGYAACHAFLWVKRPGESDGNCNGGPAAGIWWPDYALNLAQMAR